MVDNSTWLYCQPSGWHSQQNITPLLGILNGAAHVKVDRLWCHKQQSRVKVRDNVNSFFWWPCLMLTKRPHRRPMESSKMISALSSMEAYSKQKYLIPLHILYSYLLWKTRRNEKLWCVFPLSFRSAPTIICRLLPALWEKVCENYEEHKITFSSFTPKVFAVTSIPIYRILSHALLSVIVRKITISLEAI